MWGSGKSREKRERERAREGGGVCSAVEEWRTGGPLLFGGALDLCHAVVRQQVARRLVVVVHLGVRVCGIGERQRERTAAGWKFWHAGIHFFTFIHLSYLFIFLYSYIHIQMIDDI